jgi:hypothetical protein
MGIGVPFPGVKSSRGVTLATNPLLVAMSRISKRYASALPLGASMAVTGHFFFTLPINKATNQQINPCKRFIQKLTVAQLFKKFRFFRWFIIIFTRSRQFSLSWTKWMQFTHLHHTHLCTVSVLSSIIGLGLPSGLLTYNFYNRILVYISHLSTRSAFSAFHTPWFHHNEHLVWRAHVLSSNTFAQKVSISIFSLRHFKIIWLKRAYMLDCIVSAI